MHKFSRNYRAWLAFPLTCMVLGILPRDTRAAAADGGPPPIQATADFYARISARDLDGVSQYLPAEGFTEFPVGGDNTIVLARQNFAAFFTSDTAIDLHAEHLAAQEYGDTTIVTGMRVGSMTPKGQPVKVERAALTMVWVRAGGRWQVRHVHLSAASPAAVGRADEPRTSR